MGRSEAATTAAPTEQPGRASERSRRTIGGLVWSTGGYAAQGISQLVLLAVLARLLTPADFGVVTATLVVINLGRLLTHGMIAAAVVQRPQLGPGHVRAAFFLSVVTGLGAAALMVPAAPIAASFFDMAELTALIRALSALFVVHSLGTVAEGLLIRDLDFRAVALAEGGGHVLGLAGVGVVAGLLGAGVWSLVLGYLGLAATQTTVLLIRRRHTIGMRFTRAELGELLWFGGGLLGGRFFNYVALQGDNLVVARQMSAGALGAYGRAYQLVAMPAMLIGQALDRVLLPIFARVQTERTRLAGDYARALALVLLLTAPMSVVMVVCAQEIVAVMLGPGWDEVVWPLRILSLGLVARTAYKVSDTLTRAVGAVYGRATRQAGYAAMVLTGAVAGRPWGLEGVAVGVTLAIVGNHLVMAQLCLRTVPMGWLRLGSLHLRVIVVALALAPVAVGLRALAAGAPALVVLVGVTTGVAGLILGAAFGLRLDALRELRWFTDQLRGALPTRSGA